jgi:ferredoxin
LWYNIFKYISWRYYLMAYKIGDECISCGSCESECPVSAISQDENGGYVIDPDLCVECGACESVCPVGAPKQE